MLILTRDNLKNIQLEEVLLPKTNTLDLPIKVMQFGEGNFLRAFVDSLIQMANDKDIFKGKVIIIQPIPEGRADAINASDGIFTHIARGIHQGQPKEEIRIVGSIDKALKAYGQWDDVLEEAKDPNIKIVVSNTTEAGIAISPDDRFDDNPPRSFPAKVTRLLYERYKTLGKDKGKLIFIPCELIDRNGDVLKECVIKLCHKFDLEKEFIDWVDKECTFCCSLVDRIVTGYPQDEIEELTKRLGYVDNNLVVSELFHLWVIEGPSFVKDIFPLHEAGLNVIFTEDITPYRTRKVRILNGGHTSTVTLAYAAGLNYVKEMVEHPIIGAYLKDLLFEEVVPTVPDNKSEISAFAQEVLERFKNPYIKHALLDITLNSTSKLAVRVIPSLLDFYSTTGKLPNRLLLSVAGYLRFYKITRTDGKYFYGNRDNGEEYPIRDDKEILEFMKSIWDAPDPSFGIRQCRSIVEKALSHPKLEAEGLLKVPETVDKISLYLHDLLNKGALESVRSVINDN
jgi:tagaturonate reductase